MVTAQVLNHARQLLVRRSMEELRRHLENLHARRRPCPRRPGFEQFQKVVVGGVLIPIMQHNRVDT
jgi:hypothetical protein